MAILSTSWLFIEEGIIYCHWPLYLKSTLSRENAIKKHLSLILSKCIKCPVRVKKYSADYTQIQFMLKQLEEESELSSSCLSETNKKTENLKTKIRKRFRKHEEDFLFSDSDIDEDVLDIPNPPTFKPDKGSSSRSPDNEGESKEEYATNSFSDGCNSKGGVHDCQCVKVVGLVERLLRDVQEVKRDVKNILQLSNLEKINQIESLNEHPPKEKYEDLEEFNEKLVDSELFNKVQNSLALLGGRDANDMCRRIMPQLISNSLAIKMNWIGANEKGSFQKLEYLLKLIYGAIRRNPCCANITNTHIDRCIKNWLKNAPDREGGRANRKEKKQK